MLQQGARARRARSVVVVAVLLASSALVIAIVLRPRPPDRIILVVIDTLRRDRVSAYGGAVPTPNIDAFAADGTVFPLAFGAFHQTTMSMGALFTGRTPSLDSASGEKIVPWSGHTWCGLSRLAADETDTCVPAAVPTLAAALKGAGYHTAAVTSNLLLFRPGGYDRGFDDWTEVGPPESWVRSTLAGNPVVYDPKLQAGEHVNRAVQEWLERRPSDHFFLYVHYMDVHDWVQRKYAYDDGVRVVDGHVGELRQMLERAGLLDGSVVVITADHGEALNEQHALGGLPLHMGNPSFVPILAVPLVVWPRVDADRDRIMRSDDTYRLILQLARLDAGPPDLERDELFLTERLYHTYQHGRWKSLWPRGQDRPVLFDLETDPDERSNIAADHPDKVAAHRRRVDELSRQLRGGASTRGPSPDELERLRALGYAE
jgi:arylsulfatase A-like enzyme